MKVDTSNLTRKTALVMSYNIFGAVLGYITLFFVVRLIGKSAWGVLGSATAFVGLLTIIADFGLSGAHVKKIAEGGNVEEKLGAYAALKLIYGGIFVGTSFLLIFLSTHVFGFKFENEYLAMATYVVIFYFLLLSLANIFKTTLRAHMETTQAIIPDFLRVLVQDVSLIGASLWWVYHPQVPKEWVGVLYAYGYLMSVFVQLIALSFYARKYTFKKPSPRVMREYITFSLPLGFFGIVGVVQAYTDRAMLQFFWNVDEVGAYFSVQKIAMAIMTFAMAINFVLYPAQSHHFSQNNRDRFVRVTREAERYISLLILPGVAFGIVFAPEILNLWSAQLIPYANVLRILLIYAYLYVLNSPYGSQLVSAGKPKENLKAGVVQASANVILNGVLIPTSILGITLFGLKSLGAAIATLTSYALGFALIRYRVHKILGSSFNNRIILHIVSISISSLILYTINIYVYSFNRYYELFLAFSSLVLIYIGILIMTKEVKIDEILEIFNKFLKFK